MISIMSTWKIDVTGRLMQVDLDRVVITTPPEKNDQFFLVLNALIDRIVERESIIYHELLCQCLAIPIIGIENISGTTETKITLLVGDSLLLHWRKLGYLEVNMQGFSGNLTYADAVWKMAILMVRAADQSRVEYGRILLSALKEIEDSNKVQPVVGKLTRIYSVLGVSDRSLRGMT